MRGGGTAALATMVMSWWCVVSTYSSGCVVVPTLLLAPGVRYECKDRQTLIIC